MYVCVHVRVYVFLCVCMRACMYACMVLCVCACACMCGCMALFDEVMFASMLVLHVCMHAVRTKYVSYVMSCHVTGWGVCMYTGVYVCNPCNGTHACIALS